MTDALEEHEGTVSIGGKTITNFRFADDIDGLAGEKEELVKLVDHLEKSLHSLRHGDQCQEDQADDKQHQWHQHRDQVNGQKLETVTSFKYLGSVITDEGSKPELLYRIAQATAALTRLKPIWIDKSISLSSKI